MAEVGDQIRTEWNGAGRTMGIARRLHTSVIPKRRAERKHACDTPNFYVNKTPQQPPPEPSRRNMAKDSKLGVDRDRRWQPIGIFDPSGKRGWDSGGSNQDTDLVGHNGQGFAIPGYRNGT